MAAWLRGLVALRLRLRGPVARCLRGPEAPWPSGSVAHGCVVLVEKVTQLIKLTYNSSYNSLENTYNSYNSSRKRILYLKFFLRDELYELYMFSQ